MLALPADSTFSRTNHRFVEVAYERLCREFRIPPSCDFTNWDGKIVLHRNPGNGTTSSLLLALGLPNLARRGLTILPTPYVYSILGSQVDVRSSILGNSGSAVEAQQEFLQHVEECIVLPDISKSVQWYQLAVDEAKVRLNLAISPGAWLLPARMVLNTESVHGYNNALQRTGDGMRLGVNTDVNLESKKVGVHDMEGPSPNTHRPIGTSTTAPAPRPKTNRSAATSTSTPPTPPEPSAPTSSHEAQKIAVITVTALGGFVASRYLL